MAVRQTATRRSPVEPRPVGHERLAVAGRTDTAFGIRERLICFASALEFDRRGASANVRVVGRANARKALRIVSSSASSAIPSRA
jgi:hypothetical protein